MKVCLIDEINRKNRCNDSLVTVSDYEEGTGEVIQRCSCQPNFSQHPTSFQHSTGLCKLGINSPKQNGSSKSRNIHLLKIKQRMGPCTQYGFISLMQCNCCMSFRVNQQYGIEEQIPATTTKKEPIYILLWNIIADIIIGQNIYSMEIWGHYSLQVLNHRHERDENFRIIAKSLAKEAICNA